MGINNTGISKRRSERDPSPDISRVGGGDESDRSVNASKDALRQTRFEQSTRRVLNSKFGSVNANGDLDEEDGSEEYHGEEGDPEDERSLESNSMTEKQQHDGDFDGSAGRRVQGRLRSAVIKKAGECSWCPAKWRTRRRSRQ